MRIIILILFLTLINTFGFSQNFFKSYGIDNEEFEQGRKIVRITDSTSYIISINSYFAKIDSVGDIIWEKILKSNNNQNIYSYDAVLADNESLIIVSTNYTLTIVSKIDNNGNLMWQKSFGNSFNFLKPIKIIHTQDNEFVIVGSFGYYLDFYFLKIDENGNLISTKSYSNSNFEEVTSVTEAENGDFLLTGYTGNPSDIFLIRTNNIGDTIWTKIINGHRQDVANDIITLSADEYLFTGYTSSYGSANYHDDDLFLCKINGSGNILWKKTYGSSNDENGLSLFLNSDNEVIILGYTTNNEQKDIILIKTNMIGDTIFTKFYGGNASDVAYSIIQNSNGYKLLGETRSFSVGLEDICLLSFDNNFSEICRKKNLNISILTPTWWTSSSNLQINNGCYSQNYETIIQNTNINLQDDCDCVPPTANFIWSGMDGGVTFTDYSTWAYTWFWDFDDGETSNLQNPSHLITEDRNVCLTVTNDCGTDTYCEIVNGGGKIDDLYNSNLISIYPNPLINSSQLEINLNKTDNLKVIIYNSIGIKVKEVNESNIITLNRNDFQSGIYLIQLLEINDVIAYKKLLVE